MWRFLFPLMLASATPAVAQDPHAAEACDIGKVLRLAYPGSHPPAKGSVQDALHKGRTELPGGTEALPPGDPDDPAFVPFCRIWPSADALLVAVPMMREDTDAGHDGDLEILVLDRAITQVRARIVLPGVMTDDAVALEDVRFDMAPYRLGPPSFGLRFHRVGSSRADPFEQTDLKLFTLSGGRLRLVLPGLLTLDTGGETDTVCAGRIDATSVTIAPGAAAHHGLRDLMLTIRRDHETDTGDSAQNCQEHTVSRTMRATLAFDGARYPVPKDLRPFY
ncbi:hypothetical protein DMC47_38000 [Nostoc sp. 3335mG]|nr:hypothetical protein DMC47_38000 [Nostoc sp. 3335mG]